MTNLVLESVLDTRQCRATNEVGAESRQSHRQGPVRICHVSMSLATGGLERLLVEFGRRHTSEKFRPTFVALQDLGVPAEDLRGCGCEVTSMRFGQIGKLRLLRDLARFFRRHQIEVVHTHNTYAHFYGALAAQLAFVPVIVNTQHGRGCGTTWRSRLQFRIANRLTQRIVAVSDDSAALCRNDDPRSADRIIRIWNGIDIQRFEARTGPPPEAAPAAISVARLSPEKDFGTLLHAVAQVIRRVPDFRLQIVGDGRERESLEQITNDLDLRPYVEFLGERSDVPELLSRASFFVSSSKTEGVSLTLLEAAAVGLPIVTTTVGGNPEVVKEGRTGFLVSPEQPKALAEAIIRMCDSRDRWKEMGRAGRTRVERSFEISRMVDEYETLYEQLLSTPHEHTV